MSQNKKPSLDDNIEAIKLDIAEIKVDLRHHIKRSDAHESLLLQLSSFKERALGALGFVAFFATLVTIYSIFK